MISRGTVKPWRSRLLLYVKLPWCHEQPLMSCQKDIPQGQECHQKLKVQLQFKNLFQTVHNTLYDKTIY